MKASIFSVIDFYRDEQGNRRLHLHYIAAHTSAEAEATLREDKALKTTEAYVTTDEYVSLTQNNAIAAYASSMTNETMITADAHDAWVKAMTKPSSDGYETFPATYRKIY